jgi:protein-S-isoprenylcysteine O-methyltransferase Ste14
MIERIAFAAWMIFLASWWAAALWVDRATTRGTAVKRIGYTLGFAIGFVCLFGLVQHAGWRAPPAVQGALLVAELAAFAFGWWARLHLGRLWSGMLTLREGHRIVDTGPYALVRHPIYTAFIAASWAFALIGGEPSRLVGALVLTVVMTVKSREEERWLRVELGAADYDAYAARTPALVPWPRRLPRTRRGG